MRGERPTAVVGQAAVCGPDALERLGEVAPAVQPLEVE
jgi:hypothetical protein